MNPHSKCGIKRESDSYQLPSTLKVRLTFTLSKFRNSKIETSMKGHRKMSVNKDETIAFLTKQLTTCRDLFVDMGKPDLVSSVNQTLHAAEIMDSISTASPRPLKDLIEEGHTHFWIKPGHPRSDDYFYAWFNSRSLVGIKRGEKSKWLTVYDTDKGEVVEFWWKNWSDCPALPIHFPMEKAA